MSNNDILQSMERAAIAAGDIIRADFYKASLVSAKENRANLPDFVTDTDVAAEEIIYEFLKNSCSDIGFTGEEKGAVSRVKSEKTFLVDPLDGTSNFVALRDYFAVCIAYVENDEVKIGVVYDPMRKVIYMAIKGEGAFSKQVNDDGATETPFRLVVAPPQELNQFQLECELSFTNSDDFSLLQRLLPSFSGMRKSGSTALDLCMLAQGRKIVVIANGLAAHDFAAAVLIAKEAGAQVNNFDGKPMRLCDQTLTAGVVLPNL